MKEKGARNINFFGAGSEGQGRTKREPLRRQPTSTSLRELFGALFADIRNVKSNLFNGGVFALLLAFVFAIFILISNNVIVSAIMGQVKRANLDIVDIHAIEKALDLKLVIWSLLQGVPLKGTLSGSFDTAVDMSAVLPFVGLPITILLIWGVEKLRECIMRKKRTMSMICCQAVFSGIVAGIMTGIYSFRYKMAEDSLNSEWIWKFVAPYVDGSMDATFTVNMSILAVMLQSFLLVSFILILVPGFETGHADWKNVLHSIRMVFGMCVGVIVLAGIVIGVVGMSCCMPHVNVGYKLLVCLMAMGAVATSLFTGNIQWLDVILNNGKASSVYGVDWKIQASRTKFASDFDNQLFADTAKSTASSPFTVLNVLLCVCIGIVTIYFGWQLWQRVSCKLSRAAVFSVTIALVENLFLIQAQKLFGLGFTLTNGKYHTTILLGNQSAGMAFLKGFLAITVLLLVAYGIWFLMEKKQFRITVKLPDLVTLAVASVLVLVLSGIGVAQVHIESWQPMVYQFCESVNKLQAEAEGERYDRIETNERTQRTMTVIKNAIRQNKAFDASEELGENIFEEGQRLYKGMIKN